MCRRASRGQGGFTLIELMIVILIIGIIVGIAVPVFVAQRHQAQVSVCRANIRMLRGAATEYLALHQVYPTTIAELVPDHFQTEPVCPVVGTVGSYTIVSGGGDEFPVFSCAHHGTDP